jgi:hypothetical protein
MLRDGPMIDAHRVTLQAEDDFEGWRESARDLAEAGHAQQRLARRVVYVHREHRTVAQRPGELGIDVEIQHAGGIVLEDLRL